MADVQNYHMGYCVRHCAHGQISSNHFHPFPSCEWLGFAESLKHRTNHVVDFLHDSAARCCPGSLTTLCPLLCRRPLSYGKSVVFPHHSALHCTSLSSTLHFDLTLVEALLHHKNEWLKMHFAASPSHFVSRIIIIFLCSCVKNTVLFP